MQNYSVPIFSWGDIVQAKRYSYSLRHAAKHLNHVLDFLYPTTPADIVS